MTRLFSDKVLEGAPVDLTIDFRRARTCFVGVPTRHDGVPRSDENSTIAENSSFVSSTFDLRRPGRDETKGHATRGLLIACQGTRILPAL